MQNTLIIHTCPLSTLLFTVTFALVIKICTSCAAAFNSSSQILVFFETGKDVNLWISFRLSQAMTQWIVIFSLLAIARTKQFQVFLSMFINPIVCIGNQGLSVSDMRFVKIFTRPDFWTRNFTHKKCVNLDYFYSQWNSGNALISVIQVIFVRIQLSVQNSM